MLSVLLKTVFSARQKFVALGKVAAWALAILACCSFHARAQQGWPASVLGSPIYAGQLAPAADELPKDYWPAYLGPGFSGGTTYLNPGFGTLAGYEEPGIKWGDLLIRQALSTGVAYDSNIFQSHVNGVGSSIFFVSPGIDVVKNSGISIQEFSVSGVAANYFSSSPDNFTNVFLNAKNTYFLTPTSFITATASFEDGVERRLLTNFLIPDNAASPVPEIIAVVAVGYKKVGENYEAGVNLIMSQQDYSNIYSLKGQPINEEQYDQTSTFVNSYFNMIFSSHLRSDLVVQGADIAYKDNILNYDGWRVANTITADLTSKTGLSFLTGLREQYFPNNPALHPGLLAEYEGNIFWKPTDLLSFQAGAGYRDLGVNYVQGIYGGYAPYVSFSMTYWIWRNLRLDAAVNYQENFMPVSPPNPSHQDIIYCTSTLTYDFNEYLGASLQFISQQWVTWPANYYSFNEDVVQFSLKLRY